MKRILLALLATTTMTTASHAADYGVRESTAWFGELVHKWETTNSDSWNGNSANNVLERDIVETAMEAQGLERTDHYTKWGWCNEALIWAMDNVGIFEDNVNTDNHPGLNYMKGRHFTNHYNENVTKTFNHDDTFNWNDVPIGTVALLDWQSNPSSHGNLGLNHTSTFMGVAKNADGSDSNLGWFLGGNQSGKLQPKLYELEDMTFGSLFNEQGADVKKHYYDNVEEMARIKLEDGTWSKHTVSGWTWGTNNLIPYPNNVVNTNSGKKHWSQAGLPIQKFQSGNNIVYVQTADAMEVYEGQVIRSIDYFDHVEINDMKNHIGTEVMMSRKIQRDHEWWSSRTDKSFDSFKDELSTAGSQWHDRVLTASAIDEALETQWDRTFDSVFSNAYRDIEGASTEFVALFSGDEDAKAEHYDYSLARELYVEYGVEYYDEDETLMSNHFDTQ